MASSPNSKGAEVWMERLGFKRSLVNWCGRLPSDEYLTGISDTIAAFFYKICRELEERSKPLVMADLTWRMGKLRGLGHPNETMEKRWHLEDGQPERERRYD